MMGYKSAQSAPREAYFGEGLGVIWFDDFLCSGDERSLLDCSHAGVKVHNCRHSEDASAVCSMLAVCPGFSQSNGVFTVTNQQFGRYTQETRVSIVCNSGYQSTENANSVRCSDSGEWLPHTPTCSLSCPTLPTPAHGRLSTVATTPGLTVSLVCETGFTYDPSSGPPSIVCRGDGSWNASLGDCMEVFCPPYSQNITSFVQVTLLNGVGTTVGATLGFSCYGENHIVGARVISCLGSGGWNGTVPVCASGGEPGADSCPSLSPSSHLLLNTTSVSVGTVVSFSCEAGFSVNGNGHIACRDTGEWSGSRPTCEKTVCPPLSSSSHLLLNTTSVSVGTVVSFSCEAGFSVNGNGHIACRDTGEWSGSRPTCEKTVCPPLSSSSHLLLNTTSVSVGTVVGFSCEAGFSVNGNGHIACRDTGEWSGSRPTCEKTVCPPLSSSSHLLLNTTSVSVGTVVGFSCEAGFSVEGTSHIECKSTGKWSDSKPSCKEITCPQLTLSTHVNADSDDLSVDTVISFSCDSGYSLVGVSAIMCNDNGKWNNSVPSCQKATDAPPTDPNTNPPTKGGIKKGKDSGTSVGPIVGGVIGGVIVVALIVIATAVLFWKLSSRYNKPGYSNVRLRMTEDRVQLFHEDADHDADEPLYSTDPTEDDSPLDL
jgi:CUB/sushi domain-containing protein